MYKYGEMIEVSRNDITWHPRKFIAPCPQGVLCLDVGERDIEADDHMIVCPWLHHRKPLPKLPIDHPVFVRSKGGTTWDHYHFSHFRKGIMFCFVNGKTSWSTEQTTSWDEWKLPKEPK